MKINRIRNIDESTHRGQKMLYNTKKYRKPNIKKKKYIYMYNKL